VAKTAVETLGPTRVKLTVEVPFDELRPSVDAAYRRVAQQVRVKGFRPGKVPAAIIDQQVGRGTVLQEAVNEALPQFYGDAIREQSLDVIGHPEVEVTQFGDGDQLVFTAEVDVRPEFELPAYDALPVTVEDAEVTDDDVEEQLSSLRERFAVLTGAERAAQTGDYVMVDLSAEADGEALEDVSATGLSYEVGSDSLVPGLDDAVEGLSAGESKTFATTLVDGRSADVTVTVRSVKAKQVPELDDEFAQTASEFDTIEELRADVRSRMERVKRLTQGVQARDKVLDVLLERVDVPMPEHVLNDEVTYRMQTLEQQLSSAGLTKEAYADAEGRTVEELDKEIADGAQQAIKSQFVLDAIARKEELGVSEAELTEQIVRRAQRMGMPAEQYAQQVVGSGQLGSLMAEVLRGKALALVLEHAKITDESGREIDLDALMEQPPAPAAEVVGDITDAVTEVAAEAAEEAGADA
jgi:trigger factor